MSGSAGKMGGAEMKEGLKSSLLNKVKVTDKSGEDIRNW